MRKLIYIALLFITNIAFGQVADVISSKRVPGTGSFINNQASHYANIRMDASFALPRHPSNGLYGAKDSSSYMYWNTTVNKVIVYRGSSVWDTLNNNSGTLITQAQVIHLADSLLSKVNVGDSTKYVTPYYAGQNFVPYTGAKFDVDLNGHDFYVRNITTSGDINVASGHNIYVPAGSVFIAGSAALSVVSGDARYPTMNGDGSVVILGNGAFAPYSAPSNFLLKSNNLSDVVNPATALANINGMSTNSNQTGLTGNKTSNAIWNTSGQWQANGGVTPDGMGPISATMPGNSNNYAYFGMTRSGITAVGMGLDNLNAIIFGTGPTRGNGATIDTILFRLNSHTGDLMLYGRLSVPGTTTLANYYTTSGTPTFTLGSTAVVGTGASLTVTGTNQDGEITLATGTGVSATGSAFTITMNGFAYPTKCTPVIMNEIDLGASGPRMTVNSLTGTTWTVSAGGNNFTSSSTYKWTYHNGGY